MTYVVGRRFGERIVILCDTAISGEHLLGINSIPGRIKCIPLSARVSVAFAGHADFAIERIRQAWRALHTSGYNFALEILKQASADEEFDVDFLIATHLLEPELRVIRSGHISEPGEGFVIGDVSVRAEHALLESGAPPMDGGEFGGITENAFRTAFFRLFIDNGISINNTVGGLPIELLASPYGHTYGGSSLAQAWDTIEFPMGVTARQLDDQRSGMTEFRYGLVSPNIRGIGVLGIYMPAAKMAYVHEPLLRNEAQSFQLLGSDQNWWQNEKEMLETLVGELKQRARSYDYGIGETHFVDA